MKKEPFNTEFRKVDGVIIELFLLLDADLDCVYAHGNHELDQPKTATMIQTVTQRLSHVAKTTIPVKLVFHEHKWGLIVRSMCFPGHLLILIITENMKEGIPDAEDTNLWRILGRIDYLWYFFHGSSNCNIHKPFANFLLDLILFVPISIYQQISSGVL